VILSEKELKIFKNLSFKLKYNLFKDLPKQLKKFKYIIKKKEQGLVITKILLYYFFDLLCKNKVSKTF